MEKSLEIDLFCAFVTILAIIGMLGNSLILIVYTRRRDRRATNVFIRTLAALDLIVCVLVMPYTIMYEYKVVYSEFACKVFELARHLNISMSNLTLVAVAVERYVAICKPTFSVSTVHVQRGVLVMLLSSILFSVPSMWVFSVVSTETTLNNTTTTVTPENITVTCPQLSLPNLTELPDPVETYCRFTNSILGPLNTLIYQVFQMILWFFCVLVIVIVYGLIYCAVWKRDRARNNARVATVVWVTKPTDAGQIVTTDTSKNTTKRKGAFPEIFTSKSGRKTESKTVQIEQREMSATSNTIDLGNNQEQAPKALIQHKVERRINAHKKTGTMLFLCTVIYIVTWTPFFMDVFGATNSLVSRYMFFISNASNPIIYGIVNKQVRTAVYAILCGKKLRT